MPTIDEIQFPPQISQEFTISSEFDTVVTVGNSGYEWRVSRRSMPRKEFTFSRTLSASNFVEVLTFFNARRGRTYGFRFKDWTDFELTDEDLGNDGSSATLQIIKTFDDGIRSLVKNITKPVSGTVTLKKNGAAFTAFTVDTTTGVITLNAGAQAGTFECSCEYDVPVRFKENNLSYVSKSPDWIQIDNLTVVELMEDTA